MDLSCIMVIFGGTGDLTHRKLLPALYNLQCENLLPSDFAVVSVGRREKDHELYRREAYESISTSSHPDLNEQHWNDLKDRIYYYQLNFNEDEDYTSLNTFMSELEAKYSTTNKIYYLAVAPDFFGVIAEKIHAHGLIKDNGWNRVVIEKPFGKDLKSATKLNKTITDIFSEDNTYRIDHYLGKEMLQNIMVIRFTNALFEPLWNNKYIDNIQISSSETVGVENRGGYYENAGALRDMVQNHMLQLLTLIAMEPPVKLETESIRDEKVKVLRSLKEFTPELIKSDIVRGQYGSGTMGTTEKLIGYREEDRVSPISNTETFVALKIQIENFRWAGVPFYIRTGKRLPEKSTEIIIQFKNLPDILYSKEHHLQPNLLVIKIQPQEGVFFQFNAKEPGTLKNIIPVQMDFCQNCQIGTNSPEAYERLIHDVIKGDPTLFTRWDEVEYSWKFVETIHKVWEKEPVDFPNYNANTWGPIESNNLLRKENRNWWHIGGSCIL